MSEQSEFEKFKQELLDVVSGDFKDGISLGMDKARDWFLNKAKELSLDVYNYDCKMLPLDKLKKACK